MKLNLFDYNLPKNLIAQRQIKPRDKSRLLVLDPAAPRLRGASRKIIIHDYFYNLDKYLTKDDVLVFNDSKVFPARLKFDNGRVEIFLLRELKSGYWEVMGRGLRIKNCELRIKNIYLKFEVIKRLANGNWLVKFNLKGKVFKNALEKVGQTPTPPYIKTKDSKQLRQDYQTIYAKKQGSVAAPTAGLHFTKRVFNKLKQKGVKIEFITLHIGLGTFQPVKTNNIKKHKMHAEYAVLDKKTAQQLNNYKKQGKRIIAVGTTSCRVLEALSEVSENSETSKFSESSRNNRDVNMGILKPGAREVNIFVYPGYKFKFVDGLITNFHLPKSTLLMLVSALAGRTFILKAYKVAIKKKYRFYSFGDGMLIK